jgi:hypothetical protein
MSVLSKFNYIHEAVLKFEAKFYQITFAAGDLGKHGPVEAAPGLVEMMSVRCSGHEQPGHG